MGRAARSCLRQAGFAALPSVPQDRQDDRVEAECESVSRDGRGEPRPYDGAANAARKAADFAKIAKCCATEAEQRKNPHAQEKSMGHPKDHGCRPEGRRYIEAAAPNAATAGSSRRSRHCHEGCSPQPGRERDRNDINASGRTIG